MSYVPLGKPRFRFVPSDAGEMLIIPAQRYLLLILFLMAWLGGWTIGGLSAISSLFVEFHPFIAFWIVGWAIGWVAVATILSWMLAGQESVRIVGGDLEVGSSVFGWTRRKLFRGADVKRLLAEPDFGVWHGRQFPPMPILGQSRGTIRFSYGARAQSFGFGLDGTEAAEIIAWLRKRLPEASA